MPQSTQRLWFCSMAALWAVCQFYAAFRRPPPSSQTFVKDANKNLLPYPIENKNITTSNESVSLNTLKRLPCLGWTPTSLPLTMREMESLYGLGENLDLKQTRQLYVDLVKKADAIAFNESMEFAYCKKAKMAFEYRLLVKTYVRRRTRFGIIYRVLLSTRDHFISEESFAELFKKKSRRVPDNSRRPRKRTRVCQLIISSARSPNVQVNKYLGIM
eukprot:TRINITY_DN77394_c0_g1_i1.p1 TRINITY_DN77394_c0_g1~~TRINITY_DN77394_c0_g1_i1.p1  ORF type:complete len:216 (+),score=25.61 TRINITY_DN77394_c0_g1_i1:145-792(+)